MIGIYQRCLRCYLIFSKGLLTFYSDNNVINEFFRSNPNPKKLRALLCFTNIHSCIFSQMAHLNFKKLLQVLVVVISNDDLWRVMSIPNTLLISATTFANDIEQIKL